jgi:hypothetical protein
MDISKAYPAEAKINYWNRTIRLERNKSVNIREDYQLSAFLKPATLNFMTTHAVDITIPGKIILTKNGRSFEAIYDENNYTARFENVFEADSSLAKSLIRTTWGDEVNRIVLTCKKPVLMNSSEVIFRYAANVKHNKND